MDQFEAYFRRADLDGDGRISGAEAVSFFQGSNLSKSVLAQIWMHADESRSGFLSREQFFNALRLVTVAQSKRELTPEIVKAALYGPAAAKIPPPKINLPAAPAPSVQQQPNQMPMPMGALPGQLQMGAVGPNMSPGFGFRGPGVPNQGMGQQQYFPSQQGQPVRPQAIPPRPHQLIPGMGAGLGGPSQAMPTSTMQHPPQSLPAGATGLGIPNPNASANWLSGNSTGNLTGPRGVSPMTPSVTSQLQSATSVSSLPTAADSKALVVSGNGSTTGSFFGDDAFSATPSAAKQPPSTSIPASGGIQPPVKSNSLASLQNAYASEPLGGGQLQRAQSLPTLSQQVSAPSPSSISSPGISVGVGSSPDNSQIQWPKMKPTDIQKYTKVFIEVDTDRDGRITGEQARNLFLSWRLPREVLKQIWDLSDQDSDSMLSLREFCFALYLMERYREGHPLPATLPNSVMLDETLLSLTGQPRGNYGSPAWGPSPGFGQQPGMGPRPPVAPVPGLRPPVPAPAAQPDGAAVSDQQKLGAPVLEDSFLNQNIGAQQNLNSPPLDGTASGNKLDGVEKIILDSREKIEFYRTKMQDLVLYKSRCDNKLNEITERAIADKLEAEMLGKKYEEKYKQVAEVASKLTIEEATFRDIQVRKMELQQAIVNMEQGGSTDGILQVRADRIQSDLDELMKALTERCKKHGLEIKSAALIELPVGWQPGIQEGAAVWDEEWDKFEDEGFTNDLTIDVKNDSSTKPKASPNGSLTHDSLSNGDGNSGNLFNTDDHAIESASVDGHSEDESGRSPQGSSGGRTALESPSKDFSDVFAKSSEADAETHRSFDESTWGAFDTNDDVDSVWGFNPSSTKDAESENRDFFGSDDFGIKPVRTGLPSNQKRSPFFEDSVAGSPVSNRFSNSPRYSEAGDHYDSFSRFDSFSMHEGSGFSPRQEKLTRFDSINSTKDFGHTHALSSLDDSDPFGSSGPFKVSSSENHSPKKSSDHWGF